MPRLCPGESRPLREEPCPFLCAMADPRDAELGVRLAVSADAVPTLFLRAEVPQLAVLAVRDHLGLHPGARDHRRAELHVRALAHQEHLELELRAHVLRQLLDLEQVAFLDAVLLAARPDHCIHRRSPDFPAWNRPRWQGDSRRGARKGTGDLAGPGHRVKFERPTGFQGARGTFSQISISVASGVSIAYR